MPTFKELNLPENPAAPASVVLYKAWLNSLMTKTTDTSRIDAYDLNTDKDLFGVTEEAAIAAAFNAYGLENVFNNITSIMLGIPEQTDAAVEIDTVDYDGGEGTPDNNVVLTIAEITIHPDALDESVIVLPDGTENATPEMMEPYYDPTAGTLYATIGGRIGNIKLTHNRIINLQMTKKTNGLITVDKIDIEEIPLN